MTCSMKLAENKHALKHEYFSNHGISTPLGRTPLFLNTPWRMRSGGEKAGRGEGGRPESLVYGGQHLLGLGLAHLDAVGAIRQDLWLHNGHQTVLLAQGSIAGKAVCVLMNALYSINCQD